MSQWMSWHGNWVWEALCEKGSFLCLQRWQIEQYKGVENEDDEPTKFGFINCNLESNKCLKWQCHRKVDCYELSLQEMWLE